LEILGVLPRGSKVLAMGGEIAEGLNLLTPVIQAPVDDVFLFSPDGLKAFGRSKKIICMDGFDLSEALTRELPLNVVLERKVRYAAETGQAFARVRDLF
jgi:hypothetical protein